MNVRRWNRSAGWVIPTSDKDDPVVGIQTLHRSHAVVRPARDYRAPFQSVFVGWHKYGGLILPSQDGTLGHQCCPMGAPSCSRTRTPIPSKNRPSGFSSSAPQVAQPVAGLSRKSTEVSFAWRGCPPAPGSSTLTGYPNHAFVLPLFLGAS